MGRRVLVGASSAGGALALWAVVRLIVRMAFVAHALWINGLCAMALFFAWVFLGACWDLDIRWLLGAVCLLGVLFLQNNELEQQLLHQHGRTEHVRVRKIQWSAGDGVGVTPRLYTVTVLDGPPLSPIEEKGPDWKWAVGGTYAVTVDPQGRVPLRRGDRPGPPVIQQFLQIPVGLGLAFALWRPAELLLRRQRVPSAGPAQPQGAP
ncbi:hypothetical protein [Streptomyces graminilatus]|uniref:hypothetical protein n=1 Tax=Streptomyces graminilatus TaxID=1464070 RepID=UPI0006E26EF0|nr:hypothetical protein [Streptomyces graminilatus]